MKWNICLFISCSRYDSTWWQFMNQPKQSCVNIMELIVYYAYMTVWTFLYLWIFLFSSSFPRPLLRYMGTFRANPVAPRWAIANWGRCCEWGGTKLCCVCSALFIAIYPYISFIFSSLHFLASSIFLNDLQKYFFPNILTT